MPTVNEGYVVVGAGRCGLGLAQALRLARLPLLAVVSRSAASRRRARHHLPGASVVPLQSPLPQGTCYLLAVADDALQDTGAALASLLPVTLPRVMLHTSGLHPAAVLAPLADLGVALGSLHPLVAFPSPPAPAPDLTGVWAIIEGDPAAQRAAARLARRLGMKPHRLAAAHKPLYHAAAASAANLTHVLIVAAKELLLECGFSHRQASAALRPLVLGSSAAALGARGFERLTGAIARGDAEAVAAHLHALPPELAATYRALAQLVSSRLPRGQVSAGNVEEHRQVH